MKVKFLRDYHGPETNEHRYLQGQEILLSDNIGKNFVERKIVIAIDEVKEPEIVIEPVIEAEQVIEAEPVKPIAKPVVKRHKK